MNLKEFLGNLCICLNIRYAWIMSIKFHHTSFRLFKLICIWRWILLLWVSTVHKICISLEFIKSKCTFRAPCGAFIFMYIQCSCFWACSICFPFFGSYIFLFCISTGFLTVFLSAWPKSGYDIKYWRRHSIFFWNFEYMFVKNKI